MIISLERKFKRFLLKTAWLHKYGCAVLLFSAIISYSLEFITGYQLYSDYMSEILGFGLLLCHKEFYVIYFGFKKEKCRWQKASVWGLTYYCLLNLVYIALKGTYLFKDSYYIEFGQIGGLTIFAFVVIRYFYLEEIKNHGNSRIEIGK